MKNIQNILISINWSIKNPISVIKGDSLFVSGIDEKSKLEVSIEISCYIDVIKSLEREIKLYKILFEEVKGPKSHFKNCFDIYSKRLQILNKYKNAV